MAALLTFDRGEVCEDLAGADLRVREGDRDVIAARTFGLSHPAAADFCGSIPGEDPVVRLAFGGFLRVLLDADGA
jgi:hypothetical protein